MSKNLTDSSSRSGVYEGDLKYGRCNGTEYTKHSDYPADRVNGIPQNKPVVPLSLVKPRDPELWKKDPSVNEKKRKVDNSQHFINHLLMSYKRNVNRLRAGIHLTFGKQRL